MRMSNKDNQVYDTVHPYHVIVARDWFRQKPVFGYRLSDYERKLRDYPQVMMRFSAGNLIYQMMKRLRPDDWEKQDALVYAYRNLMYKISCVRVDWTRQDMHVIHMRGRKGDVMWALSFLSQVYPERPMICKTIPENKHMMSISFYLQNGRYIGSQAAQNILDNDAVPDIWSKEAVAQQHGYQNLSTQLKYDPNFRPKDGNIFALPDGRIGTYISQNQRFFLAEKFGPTIDVQKRHDISVSLMKDFEDMVRRQTLIAYDLYQVRYSAFMNKVHMLEAKLKGLDVSVYDALPIAERGLPQAKMDTIHRTNMMDHDSIKYIFDKVHRNLGQLSSDELQSILKETVQSVVCRIRGYNVEYYMYMKMNTPIELCEQIHKDRCAELYRDFAKLDALGELNFPLRMYRLLCNESEQNKFQPTEVEQMVRRAFGRGYFEFLQSQIRGHKTNRAWRDIYQKALTRLQTYMK